jgi:hypothetical protein
MGYLAARQVLMTEFNKVSPAGRMARLGESMGIPIDLVGYGRGPVMACNEAVDKRCIMGSVSERCFEIAMYCLAGEINGNRTCGG